MLGFNPLAIRPLGTPYFAYALSCANGTYAVTGQNATFKVGRSLNCNNGTYTFTGQNATFKLVHHYNLTCLPGSYLVLGQTAHFVFWSSIQDGQSPNWVNLNNTVSSTWNAIDNSQLHANWAIINNTQ